jgi:Fe-S-cluster containining protein
MTLHAAGNPRRPFPCTQCGACCQHVHLAEETRFLDRGDGTCKHYDNLSKSCAIYADRPVVCRVEQYYDTHYVSVYSWDEFIVLNQEVCSKLAALEEIARQ